MLPRTHLNAVFDLDETLVHTQESIEELERLNIFTDSHLLDVRSNTYLIDMWDPISHKGRGIRYREWGTMRPHLKEFLQFADAYFDNVIIWTAGRERYADAIVSFIYNDLPLPKAVLHYDHFSPQKNKPIVSINDAAKIFPCGGCSDLSLSLAHVNETNTLVFDDRLSNFDPNPHNGVLISPYQPEAEIEALRAEDDTLLRLMRWLSRSEVSQCSDVRRVNKEFWLF